MTGSYFLDVDLLLRESALIDTGTDPVSPGTGEVIPGTTVRGLINHGCGDDDRLREVLIVSGALHSAPALPLVDTAPRAQAVPAPTVLAVTGASRGVVDARDSLDASVESVRGLVACDRSAWRPAVVDTRTDQRLGRDRTGGDASGGPFTQTVLAAGQRFRVRLRIVAAGEDAARAVAADLVTAVHDPDGVRGLAVGAGGDNSHGGGLSVDVGGGDPALSAVPEPHNRPRATVAGDRVDLVLRSPALVRDLVTGEPDPTVLASTLQDLFDGVLGHGAVSTESTSVVRHLLGGFHGRYRGPRPEHWAAAAGSTVRVRTHRDLTTAQWEQVTAHRVGDRSVDGCGVFGTLPALAGSLGSPVRHGRPHVEGTVGLPDGRSIPTVPVTGIAAIIDAPHVEPDPDLWQLALLQDRLLWSTTARAVTEHVAGLVHAAPRPLPPRHLLATLREAAASAVDVTTRPLTSAPSVASPSGDDVERALTALDTTVRVLSDPRSTASGRRKDDSSSAGALAVPVDGVRTLRQVLTDRDAPLPGYVPDDLRQAVLWLDDDATDDLLDAWIRRHRAALRLLLVQRLLDALVSAAGEEDER
ncbi:hypothetical protein [Pseudonocardia alni]|uniref:hypothetical protein n=1 Tax=Pseudonocardia alni TaxID=33907 RepID=UPI0027A0BAA2|nr:hypothetical protein PaSha_12760 [Pseudonocardia alni]